jgi:hypothetical protein
MYLFLVADEVAVRKGRALSGRELPGIASRPARRNGLQSARHVPVTQWSPTVVSRLLLIAVVLASTSSSLRAQDKDKFKPFTSNEGKFTILMSGEPKEQKQTTKAGGMDLVTVLYVCEIDQNRALVVGYNDLPPANINPAITDKVLDSAAGAVNTGVKGTLLSTKKIALGKNPGREVKIKLPDDKGLLKVNIYLVGNRLYQVHGVGPESFVNSPQLDRYYKSFKVNE